MKILGVGLSRTGTTSLTRALTLLGFKAMHYAPERLRDVFMGLNQKPDFRRYDDVDAITDIPAAFFWKELWWAYPNLKFILTDRDPDGWFKSIAAHFSKNKHKNSPGKTLRKLVYGTSEIDEETYKKHFNRHKETIVKSIPAEKLLVMNISAGDSWAKLCPFLDCPIPDVSFPKLNVSKSIPLL
jgi:hypothetical protein